MPTLYTGVQVNQVSVQYGNVESLLDVRGDDNLKRKERKAVSKRPSKPLHVWHGETGSVRTLAENGFYGSDFDASKAIDDHMDTYFMSKRCKKNQPQGLIIEFESHIEIAEIVMVTEVENKHRYKNVCILADNDLLIACSDRDYAAEAKIKFMKEFFKEFFRPVTKSLKIVWDDEYARVADLRIYYFNPLTEFEDVEAAESLELEATGFANDVQYWKNCYTSPISDEKFPFADQGETEATFEDCARKCIQTSECMVFNWMETDGRCYLRTEWTHSLIGDALSRSETVLEISELVFKNFLS